MASRILFIVLIIIGNTSLAGNPIRNLINRSGDSYKYPNDDLLIVFDSTNVKVENSGLSLVNQHKLIKVLTAKGAKRINSIIYNYDPESAFVRFDEVSIYRKNGKIEELDLSGVLDYPAPARMIYWGARQIMISIGRLLPGDAVEIKIFRKGFTYALLADGDDEKYVPPMKGQFYAIVPFWSSDPIITKYYGVNIPSSKHVSYKFYNGKAIFKKVEKDDYVNYSFCLKNISKIDKAAHSVALSDIAPKLLISTSPDWEAKSKWFYVVNEDYGSFKSIRAINRMVDLLLEDAKNEMDSVSILTHWVADNMRYSGISMGEGEGYTLHSGEMDFTDRCGVCKDKAGLLITMLRAAGFEAYAAMTMAGSRIEDLPADQFNHSVCVVKLSDGKFHLLDPTWVPFVRELWSSLEQQQNYLMGLPEGADLMETPISEPENHYLMIDEKASISSDGSLQGKIIVKAEGQSDAAIRRYFVGNFKSKWESVFDSEMLKIFPDIEFTYSGLENPYDYSSPLIITIEYSIPEYAFVSANEIIFKAVATNDFLKRFMYNLYFDAKLEHRKYPFRDRCSRLVKISTELKLPDGFKVKELLDKKNIESDFTSFEGSMKQENSTLYINELVKFGKRIYQADEWPAYSRAVQAQKEFSGFRIILTH